MGQLIFGPNAEGTAHNTLVVNDDGSVLHSALKTQTTGLYIGRVNVDSARLIAETNPERISIRIQNLAVVPVYLNIGGTTVDLINQYNVVLKACTAVNDGTGGVYLTENFVGNIRAIAASGTGNVVVMLEL